MLKEFRKKFYSFIVQSRFFRFLLIRIIPFVRLNTYYTDIRGWKYKRGYSLLRPGDIILSKDRWKLLSFFVPGGFAHSALCVAKGNGEEFEVAEMTHSGYTKSAFFDICKEADHVVILRCHDWDDDYIKRVIDTCRSFDGKRYDTTFSPDLDTLYCTQLVVASDIEQRLKISTVNLPLAGKPVFVPGCLYKAKNVSIIWDSDMERNGTK
jgi:hypothetical protein